VQDAAQATEALQAVHRQQTMWLKTKAAMLANFSRGLRQELAEAKSHAAELEVATLHTEVAGLQSMLQQQQDFAHALDHVCKVSQAYSG
jgi:acyl-CoA reductase-like NAD-dependent aldehyde dehydrogenase